MVYFAPRDVGLDFHDCGEAVAMTTQTYRELSERVMKARQSTWCCAFCHGQFDLFVAPWCSTAKSAHRMRSARSHARAAILVTRTRACWPCSLFFQRNGFERSYIYL